MRKQPTVLSGRPMWARRRWVTGSAALTLLSVLSTPASAFEFETGNPDLKMRWDNTVRYNLGWRVESREQTLGDSYTLQAGEYRFDRGDVVTNRLDLLSEFELNYKRDFGIHLSAAAWHDAAYDDTVTGNPAYQAAGYGTAYPGNRLPNAVSRYYTSSAEVLDAFVFGRVNFGEAPLDFKVGRHNIYWGESLFTPVHGVSYSQGPVDYRKAIANPGSEVKELYLPLNQITAQLGATEDLVLAAQYALEWKPYRIYEGGTYFTYSDFLFQGGTSAYPNGNYPYYGIPESGQFKRPDDRGNWGLSAKYTPAWLDGTLGVYYRKFDEKVGAVVSDPSLPAPGGGVALVNAYAQDVKLWGISLAKQVGSVSVGAELAHRNNTALNTGFAAAGLAKGDTWHALANVVAYVSNTALFDSAVVLGELTYSRLDKLDASTAANYWGLGNNTYCTFKGWDKHDGCSTKDAWGLTLGVTPTWFQVMPGVDLSMPVNYSVGLKGNSPVLFGGNERAGTWSIGLAADYLAKYNFALTYNDYFGQYKAEANPFFGVPGIGPTSMNGSLNGGTALLRDRGWLSFTFKTTF